MKDADDFFLSRSAIDFEALVRRRIRTTAPESELTAKAGDEKSTMTPDGFTRRYGARRYELAPSSSPNASRLRATVKAPGDAGPLPY